MEEVKRFVQECLPTLTTEDIYLIMETFFYLGVESFEDLQFIEPEKDLSSVLKLVQARKLKMKIDARFSHQQQQDKSTNGAVVPSYEQSSTPIRRMPSNGAVVSYEQSSTPIRPHSPMVGVDSPEGIKVDLLQENLNLRTEKEKLACLNKELQSKILKLLEKEGPAVVENNMSESLKEDLLQESLNLKTEQEELRSLNKELQKKMLKLLEKENPSTSSENNQESVTEVELPHIKYSLFSKSYRKQFTPVALPDFSPDLEPLLEGHILSNKDQARLSSLLKQQLITYLNQENLIVNENSSVLRWQYRDLGESLLRKYPKMLWDAPSERQVKVASDKTPIYNVFIKRLSQRRKMGRIRQKCLVPVQPKTTDDDNSEENALVEL